MLVDKNATLQVIGCLMKNPQFFSESEKYLLTPDDFTTNFEKAIFKAIYNLYYNGAEKITTVDVDNLLKDYPVMYSLFETNKGIEYLQDAEALAQVDNFRYYYKRLKKFNCLRQLKMMGYDVSKFYNENPLDSDSRKAAEDFDKLEVSDIFDSLRKSIVKVESSFTTEETNETRSAAAGLTSLLNKLKEEPEYGPSLQGQILDTVVKGARKGKYYLRSGGTGTGKTRSLVGDACYLAYPIRYNSISHEWEQKGGNEKVLYIATEQQFDEIQTLILAYLTDINEDKIILQNFTEEESDRIRVGIEIIKKFEENFLIVRMPNPSIEQVKVIVRQNCIINKIDNVMYDYIFSSPSLLAEFRDLKVREDVALFMMSTALKDLAAELNVFVMSGTQLNGEAEEKKGIKNQTVLRGSKAIADKADIGIITCKVTQEEINNLTRSASFNERYVPNQVTDVYKVRRGRWVDVRIWSRMDLGTCRKEDLFITDANYHPINDFSIIFHNNKLYNSEEEINKIINNFNNIEYVEKKIDEQNNTSIQKKVDWADLL